jgi:hypothetical protein
MQTVESRTYRKRSGIFNERSASEQECQKIDEELHAISSAEIAGAYSALCGQMLAQTLVAVRRKTIRRKEEITDKKRAKAWVEDTDTGVISFRQVCEALSINEDTTKKRIKQYAVDPKSSPITKAVFGVLQNAD